MTPVKEITYSTSENTFLKEYSAQLQRVDENLSTVFSSIIDKLGDKLTEFANLFEQ